MKKLIVVADDFGWSGAINAGIIKTYLDGLVTEISYSPGFPGQEDAFALLKQHNINDVGLHMVLISPDQNTGKQLRREDYQELFREKSDAEVKVLVEQEVNLFIKQVGKPPTHITAQYGIHGNLKVLEALVGIAKHFTVPFRLPRTALDNDPFSINYAAEIILKRAGIIHTDYMFEEIVGLDYEKVKNNVLAKLATVEAGKTVELLLHPGYLDEEVIRMTSLRAERARDIALSLDQEFADNISALGFAITNYSQLSHD